MVSFMFPVHASSDDENFQNTLNQLSTKKLTLKLIAVEKLIQSKNSKLGFVLNSLLEGKIYYIKKSKKVIFTNKKNKIYTSKDLINDQLIKGLSNRQIKKVGINNKIRQRIKNELSLLNLMNPDNLSRLTAVKNIYKNIDQNTFKTIQFLINREEDAKVVEAMKVAINIYMLNDKDPVKRMGAIKSLDGSLEPIVKNELIKIEKHDKNTEVRELANNVLDNIQSRESFFETIETLFFGISFGSVLVLAAIGLAITFGVMGVINMAHGELIMLGAYTTYVVQLLMPNYIGFSILVSIPAAFIVSGLVGILIERGVIRHLHGRPLETLLATFGVSLVLQQVVRTVFSPLNMSVKTPEWMSGVLEINGVLSLTWNRLYIIIFCFIVFFALFAILKKTSLGLRVMAVSQDRNMARAMGVNSNRVDAMTFGLGSGIAGIAGVALSQLTNVGPNLGQAYIVDSFMVVVFGGVGNLWGILVSGFGLGIISKFMEPWVGAVLAKVLILIFIILFIQKRPRGLFPQKGRSAGD